MGTCDDPHLPHEPSKTHKGENLPVSSMLIAPKHRSVILAYYRFARVADDVSDSPSLSPMATHSLQAREAYLAHRVEAAPHFWRARFSHHARHMQLLARGSFLPQFE
jgi:phytoene/squalene synthetase